MLSAGGAYARSFYRKIGTLPVEVIQIKNATQSHLGFRITVNKFLKQIEQRAIHQGILTMATNNRICRKKFCIITS